MHRIEIEFENSVPSFQSISQRYEQQTGLNIRLVATVSLASVGLGQVLNHPCELLALLQADSEAIYTIDTQYKATKTLLMSTHEYEKAAFSRDQIKQEKRLFNHIEKVEIIVGNDYRRSINASIEGRVVTVEYENESYAIISFIKIMVDLGGKYLGGNELPKSWSKLKQWHNYKWYNRPRL
ncbi:hypothetical protein ACFST9_06050 [Hymenobacter monticola]|uniref:Uncharacterized protein n=2 Tax=Hymenobacter monticola TaxID=1705399 RepID=A0ABY4BEN4_9BACT|nr:hypothetical protein [Hymenobacter monticola]UOE36181.1 hypothetical protein MTP16_11180 [Hymenobacter monticola]